MSNELNINKLTIMIRSQIELWFMSVGLQVFWVEQFVKMGLAGETDVLHALLNLHRLGELDFTATVYCPEGHSIFTTSSSSPEMLKKECLRCARFYNEDELEVKIKFTLSEASRSSLEAKKKLFKASL